MKRLSLLLLLAAGCYTSPKPETYARALQPNGDRGTIELTDGRSLDVELLEVRDSAYVVLIDDRVAIAPYPSIKSASFEHQSWRTNQVAASPSARTRETLRHASRFPFGMRGAALEALLRVSGQTQPDYLGVAVR